MKRADRSVVSEPVDAAPCAFARWVIDPARAWHEDSPGCGAVIVSAWH